MNRFLICCAAVIAVVSPGFAGRSQVMTVKYPADDLVIAQFNVRQDPYRAAGDGKADDTPAFQRAIDDAAALGGGVVFAPTGTYRFDGVLKLKSGVTLRGEWVSPKSRGGRALGTILAVYAGHGEEKGPAFVTLSKVSCLRDLSIWYPRQNPENIVPYPWTVDTTDQSSCGYTVRDVTFVNSYKALSNGADDGLGYNVAYYGNLYGTPLKHGIWMEYATDITRIDRVFFGPQYWRDSGLPGAPTGEPAMSSLRKFMLDNGTGITIRRFDWCPLYKMEIDGYSVGIKLAEKPGFGDSNGQMHAVRVEGGMIGLLVESIQPAAWLISRSTFRSIEGGSAVVCRPTVKSLVQFNTCTLGAVQVDEGSTGALSMENCTLESPMTVNGGRLSLVNSRFTGSGTQLKLGIGCTEALLAGCDLPGGTSAVDAANPGIVRYDKASEVAEAPDAVYPFPAAPRPSVDTLYDVRAFGAHGDGIADDTPAFTSALSAAGKAGGGTVYVPAGRYRLLKPIVVPSNTELRGIFEGPTHTMIPGSCLLVECGHGQESGTPFISLKPHAGVRGLTVWYPKQDLTNLAAYPWTVRALGAGCWVKDVSIGNAWQGLDFASARDTGGHFIGGVTGSPMRRGIFVDNSKSKGYVENPHFVIHYWSRNDSGLPGAKVTDSQSFEFTGANLEAFSYGDCADEWVLGSFVYSDKIGLAIRKGFHGNVHFHGSDAANVGLLVTGQPDVTLLGTCCAPFTGRHPVAFLCDDQFTGRARILNSSCWANAEALHLAGTGSVSVGQLNAAVAESWILNPNARVTGIFGVSDHTVNINEGINPGPAIGFGHLRTSASPFKGTVVSRGCKATADSENSPGEIAGCAVDGITVSKWASKPAPEHWLILDLGQPCSLTGVEILHAGTVSQPMFNTRDYALQGRLTEQEAWRTLAEMKGNTADRTTHVLSGKCRYIRLLITGPTQIEDTYARIQEVRVFGSPGM